MKKDLFEQFIMVPNSKKYNKENYNFIKKK